MMCYLTLYAHSSKTKLITEYENPHGLIVIKFKLFEVSHLKVDKPLFLIHFDPNLTGHILVLPKSNI